jgi:hypothetical protein
MELNSKISIQRIGEVDLTLYLLHVVVFTTQAYNVDEREEHISEEESGICTVTLP